MTNKVHKNVLDELYMNKNKERFYYCDFYNFSQVVDNSLFIENDDYIFGQVFI